MRMSFEQYDAYVAKLLSSKKPPLKKYPSIRELREARYCEDQDNVVLNCLIWLSETLPAPQTEEERNFMKLLNAILREKIVLYNPSTQEQGEEEKPL